MLAELAAANAAFAVIKTTVQNGGDLAKIANKIADYTYNKTDIEKKAREDKSKGNASADLESFMALEQIRDQEVQLKEMMIWAGNPGEWDRWQKFQAEARVQRQEEEKEREAFATEMYNNIGWALVAVTGILGLAGLAYLAIWLKGL